MAGSPDRKTGKLTSIVAIRVHCVAGCVPEGKTNAACNAFSKKDSQRKRLPATKRDWVPKGGEGNSEDLGNPDYHKSHSV